MFCKKDVLKEFTKFTRKPFVPEACNFIKKETLAQVFSCEFCEFLKTPFLAEHLRWLLLSIAFMLLNTNLSITLSTFLFAHMQALNQKLELMGEIMKHFSKKLLSLENLSSVTLKAKN